MYCSRRKTVCLFSILILSLMLTACNKYTHEISTAIGAGTGALLGYLIGDDDIRILTTSGGAVIGGFIGSEIGKYLETQDQKKHALATQKAFSTGKNQSWSNPETNTSGKARVVNSSTEKTSVNLPVLKKKVKQVPPLDIIGSTYQAKTTSNLRGGPGTDYEKVGSLPTDKKVNVVGKVKGKEWYLISYDGVGSGFVYADLLKPTPTAMPDDSKTQIRKQDISNKKIADQRKCRTIEQSVSLADGSTKKETVKACQGPNGWEVQS